MFPKQNSSGLLVPVLMILGLNIFTGSLPPLGKHTVRDQLLPLGSFDFSLLMWAPVSPYVTASLQFLGYFMLYQCCKIQRLYKKKCVYTCRHMCVHVHKGVKVCFHDFSCVHGMYVHVCTSI